MGSDTSKAYPTIADSSSNSNDGTITNGASDDIVQQMVAGYDMGAFESTEELSAEKATGTTWTKQGVTGEVAEGSGNITHRVASEGNGTQSYRPSFNLTTTSGKVYKLVITPISKTGTVSPLLHNGSSYLNIADGGTWTWDGNSTKTYYYNGGNGGFISFDGRNTFDITFTMSFKEVLQSADLSDTYPAIIDVNEPVLGAELFDADAQTFDSGTHSWVKYGNNTITNDNGALKITYVNNALGAYLWLKDASDLSTDLTIGKTYKFTFDAKVSSGASVDVTISTLAGSPQVITETSFTTKSIYFTAENTNSTYVDTRNMGSGEIIYLDNLSLKEIQGNPGTMTNQASDDLVYSSVLPDQ